jgi:hypothetical protein
VQVQVVVREKRTAAAAEDGPEFRTQDDQQGRREHFVHIVIVVRGQCHLLQIVAALGSPCRFTGGLNGRQQQGDQHGNNGDHHQQFNERKTPSPITHLTILSRPDIKANDLPQPPGTKTIADSAQRDRNLELRVTTSPRNATTARSLQKRANR